MSGRPALPEDIKELMRLVRAGKLFDVQKWIAEGKRTTPPEPYWFSPFRVAVETGFHSMIELLLQQGVDAEERDYMLQRAVGNGNFEVIKLLVDYGANIHAVDLQSVCWTGHPFIIQYFLDRGIDAETDFPFARALCYPRRRFLGIYMRYRDKIPSFKYQLNLALRYHAQKGNLKWVLLLLWAGGDGHLRLPEIGDTPNRLQDTSAVEEAAARGNLEIVEKIGVNPRRDNVQRMFETVCLLGRTESQNPRTEPTELRQISLIEESLICAFVNLAASEAKLDKYLPQWAEALSKISGDLESRIKRMLGFDRLQIYQIYNDSTQGRLVGIIAALRMATDTEAKLGLMFLGQATLLDGLTSGYFKEEASDAVGIITRRTWNKRLSFSVEFPTPRITIPAIQAACDEPVKGFTLAARILLQARFAVPSIRLLPETLQKIKTLANIKCPPER